MARHLKSRGRFLSLPSAVERFEPRLQFAGGAPLVVGYLPDYEVGSGAIITTLANARYVGLTQVDYFSILPNANGLLPGTAVGSLSNTGTTSSGGYALNGSNAQLTKLVNSAHANGVKVDVVIGGGGGQSSVLGTVVKGGSTLWQNFAASVTQFVAAHGIDGIDIDWEPDSLGPTDTASYGNFLAAVRQANPNLDISAAVNAGKLPVSSGGSAYVLNATGVQSLTSINVMAYDLLAGNTSPTALAQSYLNGWGSYVQSLGVSKNKLIFGMPFYGTSGNSWATTIASKYTDLVKANGTLNSPSADSIVINGVTWNYNGPVTIGAKTTYALVNGYGGVATWEVGQDYLSGGAYDDTYSLLPRFKQAVAASTAAISGTVSTASGALAGVKVYADTNNDGRFNTGEPAGVTNATGAYVISGLLIGNYAVRQVTPSGYTQTTPAAGGAVSLTLTVGQTGTANFVDKPPLIGTSLTLTNNGPSTSNATQSLSFSAAITGAVPAGATILLEDASRGNLVVASATLAGGTAQFTVPAGALLAGSHGLFAVYAGDATFAASASATLTQSVQVVVTGVSINGNLPALAGPQRSMVDSVLYTFSEPVDIAAANAATLSIAAGQSGVVPTMNWTATNPGTGGASTQWAVQFSGSGVANGSIANGVYDLVLNASAFKSDANALVSVQARAADTFYRLFGDADGNRTVDFNDFLQLQNAFGATSGSAAFIAALDSDGSQTIDFNDFLALQNDFGLSVPTAPTARLSRPGRVVVLRNRR